MAQFCYLPVSIRLLLLLSLGVFLSGCVVFPTGSTGPMDDMGGETLIGKTTQEIHDLLGEAEEKFEMEDVTYLLYTGTGIKKESALSPFFLLVYLPTSMSCERGFIQSLLMALRNNSVVN